MNTEPVTDAVVNSMTTTIVPSISKHIQAFIDLHSVTEDDYFDAQEAQVDDRIDEMNNLLDGAHEKENINEQSYKVRINTLEKNCSATVGDAINKIIETELRTALPESAVWFSGNPKPNADYCWVVGTHISLFSTSSINIALQEKNEIVVGLTWNSNHNALAIGEKGYAPALVGSDFPERVLSVSTNGMQENTQCIYILPDYFLLPLNERENATYKKFMRTYGEKINAFTLPMHDPGKWLYKTDLVGGCITSVAANLIDFVYAAGFDYHHVAAAMFILEQAGGSCTDFSGEKTKIYTGEELICGNPALCAEFCAAMQN